MKIFIVTEGGKSIGFGHVTRCLALYEAFKDAGAMPKLIINGDGMLKSLLKGRQYKSINWIKRRQVFLETIRNADVAVIDSYLAGSRLYRQVAKAVKLPVFIDDYNRIDYPAGVVVNGSIYAERLDYRKRKKMAYLLGSPYALLRKEFWKAQPKKTGKAVKAILVTFGGSDPRNMTLGVLKALCGCYPLLKKIVIIGRGFDNIKEIEAEKDKNTKFVYFPDAAGMKDAMAGSDIAVSAGGQTLYELARMGVPAVSVAVAKNQLDDVLGFEKAGFIDYAGDWKGKSAVSALMGKIEALISDAGKRAYKSRLAKKLLDGQGARRVACAIKNNLIF